MSSRQLNPAVNQGPPVNFERQTHHYGVANAHETYVEGLDQDLTHVRDIEAQVILGIAYYEKLEDTAYFRLAG